MLNVVFAVDSFVQTNTIYYAYGCTSHAMLNQAAMLLSFLPLISICFNCIAFLLMIQGATVNIDVFQSRAAAAWPPIDLLVSEREQGTEGQRTAKWILLTSPRISKLVAPCSVHANRITEWDKSQSGLWTPCLLSAWWIMHPFVTMAYADTLTGSLTGVMGCEMGFNKLFKSLNPL